MPLDVFEDVLYHFRFENEFLYRLYEHVPDLKEYIHVTPEISYGSIWHLYPRIAGWDIIS